MSNEENDVKFIDFPLRDTLHESLRNAGFQKPTPIQGKTIPEAIEGKDIIGLAQTGTGKTASFAIPIIHRLANRVELGALVLAPTRELAAQITAVFEQLGSNCGIRVATIVGGVPMENDEKALKSWPNVLVATPGRLIDHIENASLSLNEIEILAIDEADRMHDMGFIPQINRIISVLPPKRQTLMFTATMHRDVERIVRKSMNEPVRIQVGRTAPAHRAKQELFELAEAAKGKLLLKLLGQYQGHTLVFLRTKRGVDRVANIINARNLNAVRIHGDMEHVFREKSLEKFRSGESRILVATDIAARGLDVSNIEHVVNYDFPHQAEDYVHRIGRTARVEASGVATSFITPADRKYVREVGKLIGDKLPKPIRLESYDETAGKSARGRGKSSRGARPQGRSKKRSRRPRSSSKRSG